MSPALRFRKSDAERSKNGQPTTNDERPTQSTPLRNGRPHIFQAHLDPVAMGAMGDDADADDKLPAYHARREHDALAGVDARQQLAIVHRAVLEREDAELRLGHDLDSLDRLQTLGRV